MISSCCKIRQTLSGAVRCPVDWPGYRAKASHSHSIRPSHRKRDLDDQLGVGIGRYFGEPEGYMSSLFGPNVHLLVLGLRVVLALPSHPATPPSSPPASLIRVMLLAGRRGPPEAFPGGMVPRAHPSLPSLLPSVSHVSTGFRRLKDDPPKSCWVFFPHRRALNCRAFDGSHRGGLSRGAASRAELLPRLVPATTVLFQNGDLPANASPNGKMATERPGTRLVCHQEAKEAPYGPIDPRMTRSRRWSPACLRPCSAPTTTNRSRSRGLPRPLNTLSRCHNKMCFRALNR